MPLSALFVLLTLLGTLWAFLKQEHVSRVRYQTRNDRVRSGIPVILRSVFYLLCLGWLPAWLKAQCPRRQHKWMRLNPHRRVICLASAGTAPKILQRLALSYTKEATKPAPLHPWALGSRTVRFRAGKEQERPRRPLSKKDLETPAPSQATRKAFYAPPSPAKTTRSPLPSQPDPVRPTEGHRATASPSGLSHPTPWDHLLSLGHRWPWVERGLLKPEDPPRSQQPLTLLQSPRIMGQLQDQRIPEPPIENNTHWGHMEGPETERQRYTTTYLKPWPQNNTPRVQSNTPPHNNYVGSTGKAEHHITNIRPSDQHEEAQHEDQVGNIRSPEPDTADIRLGGQCEWPQPGDQVGHTTTLQPTIPESRVCDQQESPQPNHQRGVARISEPQAARKRRRAQSEGPPQDGYGGFTSSQETGNAPLGAQSQGPDSAAHGVSPRSPGPPSQGKWPRSQRKRLPHNHQRGSRRRPKSRSLEKRAPSDAPPHDGHSGQIRIPEPGVPRKRRWAEGEGPRHNQHGGRSRSPGLCSPRKKPR